MYMMVRQKLSKITDLNLLEFLNTRKRRDMFLTEHDLQFHEQEQVLGVGFHIRDRIKEYLDMENGPAFEASVPYVLALHRLVFPHSAAKNKLEGMQEWLDKADSKLFLATGIYFLNHFEGMVTAETTYVYQS